MYPRAKINLKKMAHNVERIAEIVAKKGGCSAMIVTKAVCADKEIVKVIEQNEKITYYADSRIENLERIGKTKKMKVLLRLPMLSDVKRVVQHADVSLNSEIQTIRALNVAAKEADKTHKIILMIDLGDLREGIYFTNEDEIFNVVSEILGLKNVELHGIGVNLTCYGAIIPKNDNLSQLVDFANKIEEKFDIKLKIVSGGNSSSIYLIDKDELPKGINNLRIGEAVYLANETAYSNKIENMHDDVVTLEAEIIELKEKPSLPVGEPGVDAFGEKPVYEDKGIIKRAILAVGRQDIDSGGLIPLDNNIEILGASSDHMILDVTNSETEYKLGDTIEFKLEYGALLKIFTSEYVTKIYE